MNIYDALNLAEMNGHRASLQSDGRWFLIRKADRNIVNIGYTIIEAVSVLVQPEPEPVVEAEPVVEVETVVETVEMVEQVETVEQVEAEPVVEETFDTEKVYMDGFDAGLDVGYRLAAEIDGFIGTAHCRADAAEALKIYSDAYIEGLTQMFKTIMVRHISTRLDADNLVPEETGEAGFSVEETDDVQAAWDAIEASDDEKVFEMQEQRMQAEQEWDDYMATDARQSEVEAEGRAVNHAVKFGVVCSGSTDGFGIMAEFADGSQSEVGGWFGSVESAVFEAQAMQARACMESHGDDFWAAMDWVADHGVPVENWTA